MRPIENEHTREARQRRRQFILSAFLIVILLGSTIGYAVSLFSEDDQANVQGSDGEPFFNGQQWVVPYGSTYFILQSGPDEVKNVSLETSILPTQYYGKPVFIASESPAITQELTSVLEAFAQRVQPACYGACDAHDLPEKDCTENLIVWRGSETNRVYTNNSCVFIEGDYVAADAFLYRLLGQI